MDSSAKIDWENQDSHALLNPKLPTEELQKLADLAQKFSRPGHVWISSSGSSATANQSAKLIALSKSAFLASASAVNRHLQSTKQDVWVQALPRFHVGGLSIETRAFLSGAAVVSGLAGEKWDPHFFYKAIQNNKGSLSALVPTQVFDLIREGLTAPSTMRAIVIGGSALGAEVYNQATDLGWPLLPSYGLTECCSQVATASLEAWKSRDTRFQILSHVQARTNEEGILQIHSPALLTGYAQWIGEEAVWKDPKLNGWYQTEDLVEIQGEVLKPLGRGSDYVKVSGEGVNLLKLQEMLETLAQKKAPNHWQQMALSALPDPRSGSALVLAVSGGVQDSLIEEIVAEFNRLVAPFERIKQALRTNEIPRTALGKIAREKLKNSLLSQTR